MDIRIEAGPNNIDGPRREIIDPNDLLGPMLPGGQSLIVTALFETPEASVQALAKVLAERDAEIVDLKEQRDGWKQAAEQAGEQRNEARRELRKAGFNSRRVHHKLAEIESHMRQLRTEVNSLNEDDEDTDGDDFEFRS